MRFFLSVILVCTFAMSAFAGGEKPKTDPFPGIVDTYIQIVYQSYGDSARAAEIMQEAIDAFLALPNEKTMAAARIAWVEARKPYLQTEAYRFYDGPIDFADPKTGKEGPEGRLNSWPLNEAYIDYVQGNPSAGIIQQEEAVDTDMLIAANQAKDEGDVSTGFHAIEFLLWGQDLSKDGPGARPYTDYLPGKPTTERRRAYLQDVTALLVADLQSLEKEWASAQDNYAAAFRLNPRGAASKLMTGISTLAGFELASERLGTALDSGIQEDEQSCFSDTTHQDFIYDIQGIENVYRGTYGSIKGESMEALLKEYDPELERSISESLFLAKEIAARLPQPFDSAVLGAPEGSPARADAEKLVKNLQNLADLLVKAGDVLKLKVQILSD